MSKNLLYLSGVDEAPKSKRSKMDTIIITPELLKEWQLPLCQRPIKINKKVREVAEELKENGGFISGVITLGTLNGRSKPVYLLDGQHRCEGFKLSELKEAIADVRICDYDSEVDMGDDWVKLNSSLVKMTPDNILHALEGAIPAVGFIKQSCECVGYDNVRRGTSSSTMLSMSVAIRCWSASRVDTAPSSVNKAVQDQAREMSKEEYENLVNFILIARAAWGTDSENARLWGVLNLTICMWFFRRLVIAKEEVKTHVKVNRIQFQKCLMSLSASGGYLDWLLGRSLSERDRGPCFRRMKTLFTARIKSDTGTKVKLPHPPWGGGGATDYPNL